MKRFIYITALAAAVMFSAMHHRPAFSSNTREHLGAHLPRRSSLIEENRFKSPWTWNQTMTWIDRNYDRQSFPRISIVNLPGIKAVHLANRTGRWQYSGINIYEMQDGEVRFYVVPRQSDN